MMKTTAWMGQRFLRWTMLATALAAAGCAADAADDDAAATEGAQTADPRGELAKKVDHIELGDGESARVVGAPKKIADVLAALRGSISALPPGTRPRCPPRLSVTMFDAQARAIATLNACGAGKGILSVGGRAYQVPVSEDRLVEIGNRREAVGDLLYGITKVVGSDGDVALGGDTKIFLDALDRDEVPEARNAEPRCMPIATLTFFRGDLEAGKVSLYCGQANSRGVDAKLVAGPSSGWISYRVPGT